MRPLPPVVDAPRRRGTVRRVAVVLALAAASALTLAGCARFDAALGQRLAIVSFAPGTSQATMMKVRAACAKVPATTAVAIPPGLNKTTGMYEVQYRIDQASDADVAKLEQCLSRYPSVQGVNLDNPGEEGG